MEKFRITLDGVTHEVEVEKLGSESTSHAVQKSIPSPVAAPAPKAKPAPKKVSNAAAGASVIPAPMPGKVLSVSATVGQAVKRGDVLLVLEAMKMANEIMAPVDGTVKEVNAAPGQAVSTGEVLVILE